MCLQITDMDLAVQKILSDHRVLSLLFLTFPKAQKVRKRSFGIKITFAQECLYHRKDLNPYLAPEALQAYQLQGRKSYTSCVLYNSLHKGCFLLFVSLNLILAQCYFLSQASLIPYPNHSQDEVFCWPFRFHMCNQPINGLVSSKSGDL